MHFKSKRVLLIGVTLLAFTISSFASAAVRSTKTAYAKNELIIKYKPDTFRIKNVMAPFYQSMGVLNVKRLANSSASIVKGMEQWTLRDGVDLQDTLRKLNSHPMVEYAQPNYRLYVLPVYAKKEEVKSDPLEGMPGLPCFGPLKPPICDPTICITPNVPAGCTSEPLLPGVPGGGDGGGGGGTPPPANRPALQPAPAEVIPAIEDPDMNNIYGIGKIAAPTVWNTQKGSKEVIVAVVDTGIDYNHPDLAFNVWRNPNPTKGDDIGWDFIHNDGLPYADDASQGKLIGHGSHVSGTIGAVGGNGIGIAGINHRVSIMALKFLSAEGSGTTAGAIEAIDYAATHGARVMNNSWGGPAESEADNKALKDVFERAAANNVLAIIAAGNETVNNDDGSGGGMFGGGGKSYPAAFELENGISVAATDSSDRLASFSNFGVKTTHIAAPGVAIYSTISGNSYMKLDGTSMACPHVVGAAALIMAEHPNWDFRQVKKAILESADPISGLKGKVSTAGRLNVSKAITFRQ